MLDSFTITFGGRPVIDPQSAMRTCREHDFPDDHFRGLVSTYVCPVGSKPGVGRVLMRKSDLDRIPDASAVTLSIVYRDGAIRRAADLRGMVIVANSMAFPGRADDPDSVFLVTFADERHSKRRLPWSKAYNLRDRCEGEYISATTNAGTPWTWQQLVQDLWTATIGGSAPSLPYTPHGTPEGFDYFHAESALDCLADVLLRIDCHLVHDPRTLTYAIRRSADGRTALMAFDSLQRYYAWQDRASDWPAADWPETIRVWFRRRPIPEEEADSYYAVDVTTAPAPTGFVAGTILAIHDDLYAQGSSGTPSNLTDLTARAEERMSEWVRRESSIDYPTTRSYKGFLPDLFNALGETVSVLCFSDRGGSEGAAFTTEVRNPADNALNKWKWNDNSDWLCCFEDDYPYPYGSYDDGDGGASVQHDAILNLGCDAATTGNILYDSVRYTTVGLVRRGRLTLSISMEALDEDVVAVETECVEVVIKGDETGDTDVKCVVGDIVFTKKTKKIRAVVCKACP